MLNQRASLNLLIYNISSKITENTLLKQKEIFKTYMSKSSIIKEIKKKYQSESLKAYRSDTKFINVVDPRILEDTGGDFNYWLNQASSTILSFIEQITSFVKDESSTDFIRLASFKDVVKKYLKGLSSSYEREKYFLQQGPTNITFNTIDCSSKEWYSILEFGIQLNDVILENIEKVITSIDLLYNYLEKIKYKNTRDANLSDKISVTKYFDIEIDAINKISRVFEEIDRFTKERYIDYYRALKIINEELNRRSE